VGRGVTPSLFLGVKAPLGLTQENFGSEPMGPNHLQPNPQYFVTKMKIWQKLPQVCHKNKILSEISTIFCIYSKKDKNFCELNLDF